MRMRKINSGQSLVEFALIFPILFLLVMGLSDIGRAIFYYATLNTAVREGTRFAIVQPYGDYLAIPDKCTIATTDLYPLDCNADCKSKANINICNAIKDKFFSIGELSSSTIKIDHTGSHTPTADPQIKITIDYLFKPVTPGLALIANFTIQVNSQMTSMPIAQP